MRKVAIITEQQKNLLKNQQFMPDVYFNPIQDLNNNWVISKEEIVQITNANFNLFKTLPLVNHQAKIDEVYTPPVEQGTAPFIIKNPTLPARDMCASVSNSLRISNMEWGGSPTPTITYSWYKVNNWDDGNDQEIGQYTNTLYLNYGLAESQVYCLITATNSSGIEFAKTELVNVYDCS